VGAIDKPPNVGDPGNLDMNPFGPARDFAEEAPQNISANRQAENKRINFRLLRPVYF
jgi:hypothetical protein